MKLVLSLVIIGASTFVGFCIRKSYAEKYNFFSNLLSLIDFLKVDISFFQNKIIFALNKYKPEVSGLCLKMLESYINYLKSNEYDKKINEFVNLDFLPQTQAETVLQLLDFIGSSDSSSQCEMLENYKLIISEYAKESSNKLKKYGNFALKMSLSIGLAIVIIAI